MSFQQFNRIERLSTFGAAIVFQSCEVVSAFRAIGDQGFTFATHRHILPAFEMEGPVGPAENSPAFSTLGTEAEKQAESRKDE